jgi:hypothetical protein
LDQLQEDLTRMESRLSRSNSQNIIALERLVSTIHGLIEIVIIQKDRIQQLADWVSRMFGDYT